MQQGRPSMAKNKLNYYILKKKTGKQIPVKARICAKPWWEDGVHKADLTAFRSDLGISCIRLVYLAMDLGKSDPIPRLLVPLHLSFKPIPFCLQTEAHEAPPWTTPQRHSPLWSCLAYGCCQGASSPSTPALHPGVPCCCPLVSHLIQ